MKKPIFYLVLFFSCSFLNPAKSQVLADDSLALLDLYLETDGPNWTNNQNWLNSPVNTWFVITVEINRVTKVELPINNLMGLIPASFNDLTALRELVLNNNGITAIADLTNLSALSRFIVNNNRLKDLTALLSSILGEVNCANNALNFADLEPLGIFPINNFVYAPQANVGQEGFLYAQEGATFQIPGEGESTNNLYRWFTICPCLR